MKQDRLQRVLIVSEHYPPTMGGVATSAQRIARHLARLDVTVNLVTFDHSRPLESADYVIRQHDEGTSVHRIGPFFLKHPDPNAAQISEKHRAILRRRAFDQIAALGREMRVQVILSLYVLNAGFMAGLAANALRLPHVAGIRGNDVGRNIFDTQRFAVIQWTLQRAARIACVNQHLRERLLVAFPELAPRVLVVANGVPPPEQQDTTNARRWILEHTGWAAEDLILVFIGTPREKKGIVPLLAAMEALPADLPVRLLVVGPPLSGIERHLAATAWDGLVARRQLHVTGTVPRGEVHTWVRGGDVVIMPSTDDGMANGLLEGMSLGLCPFASPVFADVVTDGTDGVLVAEVTASAIARGIRDLAGDRARVRRLGAAARQTALRHHAPHDEAARYRTLLAEAAGLEPE